MRAWEGLTAVGPAETGMTFLRGDETSEEIVVLAYGMETGLGGFYAAVGERSDDADVVSLATKLAEIEGSHRQRLFDLYLSLDPRVTDKEEFESDIVPGILEGGFTTEEFMEQNKDSMQTLPDVLNMAMMLEAQALDLYMRYSDKVEDEGGKAVLYDLAEEEKAHLTGLGRLMEQKV